MKKRFGFTLIELLIVIAIIGILATMGAMAYGQYTLKARDSLRKADLGLLSDSLKLYAIDHGGEFPDLPVADSDGPPEAPLAVCHSSGTGDRGTNWAYLQNSVSSGGIKDYIENGVLPIDPLSKCKANSDTAWEQTARTSGYTVVTLGGKHSVWGFLENKNDPDRNGSFDRLTGKYKNLYVGEHTRVILETKSSYEGQTGVPYPNCCSQYIYGVGDQN